MGAWGVTALASVGIGVGSKGRIVVINCFGGKVLGRAGIGVVDRSGFTGAFVTDSESGRFEIPISELQPMRMSSTALDPHSLMKLATLFASLSMGT